MALQDAPAVSVPLHNKPGVQLGSNDSIRKGVSWFSCCVLKMLGVRAVPLFSDPRRRGKGKMPRCSLGGLATYGELHRAAVNDTRLPRDQRGGIDSS